MADNMLIVMLLNAATQCLWPTVPTGCGPQPAKRVHTPRAAWRAAPPRADLMMTPPFWYLADYTVMGGSPDTTCKTFDML